jgi:hypothetical protein
LFFKILEPCDNRREEGGMTKKGREREGRAREGVGPFPNELSRGGKFKKNNTCPGTPEFRNFHIFRIKF